MAEIFLMLSKVILDTVTCVNEKDPVGTESFIGESDWSESEIYLLDEPILSDTTYLYKTKRRHHG